MIAWIICCISTVSYTFLVNGGLTHTMQARKGLRQGDPMSSYVFVLIMEYLNSCLGTLQSIPDFNFHPRCERLGITHLCFADDLLLFARGDTGSVMFLKEKFDLFSAASGLKTNLSKSQVYFGGVSNRVKEEILQVLGYEIGELPVKYMGVPLSTRRLNITQCMPLVAKMTARITSWMAKGLSYAGRVQMIRSGLFGIQSYWSQLFILPQKIIKLIEAICRSYLWTGQATVSRRALVAWERVCLPQAAGGLNILNMKLWNQAAISKLLWALSQHKEKLWITWVHTYYIKNQNMFTMAIPKQASWMVRKILNMRKYWHTIIASPTLVKKEKFHIQAAYIALRVPVMAR
ncbi:uncharacterized protein LOC132047555 [Lycium ferocissimum]|uniref:uncharacterized protein LOC132047555 n=1 Tax=Lycium ferocissimum TaxID=112874 RepID=UPI002814BDE1|nr:uncharacterized protein LOC132047555 [Lycium ferocissimum]